MNVASVVAGRRMGPSWRGPRVLGSGLKRAIPELVRLVQLAGHTVPLEPSIPGFLMQQLS